MTLKLGWTTALLIITTSLVFGQITFQDVTTSAGVSGALNSTGVSFSDYDNDGDPDILVILSKTSNKVSAGTQLYRNNGNGTFTLVTGALTIASPPTALNCGIMDDYNNDGFLDVFIANASTTGSRSSYLFKNNGNGTFSDVSTSSKISSISRSVFAAAWFDFNNDGMLDIFCATQGQTQYILWKNMGNGTFTDVATALGVTLQGNARGIATGDYAQDGDLDVYIPNTGSTNRNHFFRNDLTKFTEIGGTLGVADLGKMSQFAQFADYDNDGDLDLMAGSSGFPLRLYKNTTNSFTNVAAAAGFSGMFLPPAVPLPI